MKKRILIVVVVLALLVLVALLLRPSPVEVEIGRVERRPLQTFVEEEGQTRVRDRYVVGAPVTGQLQRVEFEPGDPIEAGAPLFRILPSLSPPLDPRSAAELRQRLRAAEAGHQAAIAHAEFTRAELERVRELTDRGALAARDLELAETEAETARRQVQETRATADALRAQLGAPTEPGTGAIVVHAPVGGVVLRRIRESEGVVPAGTPILEIGDVRTLEVVTDLLSEEAVRVEVGAEVLLERWGGKEPLRGRVRRVEPSGYTKVSALGVEEQRVDVVIDFLSSPEALGDGYRVISRIVTFSADDALVVPSGALLRTGPDWSVFRVTEGRAELLRVRIGARGDDFVQILEGLEPGDEVVLYPGDRIEDGARVRFR